MRIDHQTDVNARRREAYPPLADFADAYYWQQMGNPKPMQDWLARVAAVKKAFPKS